MQNIFIAAIIGVVCFSIYKTVEMSTDTKGYVKSYEQKDDRIITGHRIGPNGQFQLTYK